MIVVVAPTHCAVHTCRQYSVSGIEPIRGSTTCQRCATRQHNEQMPIDAPIEPTTSTMPPVCPSASRNHGNVTYQRA